MDTNYIKTQHAKGNLLPFFLLIFSTVILLPICLFSFFNFPQSDDWAYAVYAKLNTFIMANYGYYSYINGRYLSTFIMLTFNPLCYLSFNGFKFTVLVFVLLTAVGYKTLFQVIFNQESRIKLWLISFFFTSIFISSMPSIAEGFFWLSGTATYQTAHILLLLLISRFLTIKDQINIKNAFII